MDDFLFDPWSADGADAGSPPAETTEEEEAGGEESGEEARTETKSPRRWTVRSEPARAPKRPSPSAAFHSIPDHPRLPGEGQPSLMAERLRKMAVPRLEELATRLRAARHRTLLDDCLDGSEPVLRFRLIPWEGPFDETPEVVESVFELVLTGPNEVTARFWMDPAAEAPQGAVQVTADELDGPWLDRVLVDFVGKVLQRG